MHTHSISFYLGGSYVSGNDALDPKLVKSQFTHGARAEPYWVAVLLIHKLGRTTKVRLGRQDASELGCCPFQACLESRIRTGRGNLSTELLHYRLGDSGPLIK